MLIVWILFFHTILANRDTIKGSHSDKKNHHHHPLSSQHSDTMWTSSVSGRTNNHHYNDNMDEWVFVMEKYMNKEEIKKNIDSSNINGEPFIHIKTKKIGRYYLYIVQGDESTVHSIFKTNKHKYVVFTKNHRIEIGPGHDDYNYQSLQQQPRRISPPKGMTYRNDEEENKKGEDMLYYTKKPLNKKYRHPLLSNSPPPSDMIGTKKYSSYWGVKKDNNNVYNEDEAECRTAPQHVNRGYVNGAFSWGIDRCDQRRRTLDGSFCGQYTGTGVHVYIVDTGVSEHTTFRHTIRQDYSYFTNNGIPNGDWHGHGTHVGGLVASEIYGVAPDAIIHAVQILNQDGIGSFASMIAGLLWIEENKSSNSPAVINLSLGAHGASSTSVESIISRLVHDKGITVVVSAGNYEDTACTTFPANLGVVITVAAIDSFDRKPGFSNDGRCVDIFSPGVDIISCHSDGINSRILSGTSMSSPIVTGEVASLLEENPSRSPETIKQLLINRATKGTIATGNLRSGTPNSLLYIGTEEDTGSGGGGNGGSPSSASHIYGMVDTLLLLMLMIQCHNILFYGLI